MNAAIAKVLPPDKHPLVCDTKAESIPTTHEQVPTAPRSIPSLSHRGSHSSHTWYPAPTPQAGDSLSTQSWRPDGRTRRGAHLLWLGVNQPFHPAPSPSFLWSMQPPGWEQPPPPLSTEQSHPVPLTPISSAGVPHLPYQKGSTQFPRPQQETTQT